MADKLIVTTILFSVLLVASVGIAVTSTKDEMRSVSLPVSTYEKLMQFGDAKRCPDGTSMSIVQAINFLVAGGEGRPACVSP